MEQYRLTSSQKILILPQVTAMMSQRVREYDVLSFYFLTPGECNLEALEKAYNRLLVENDALRLKISYTWRGIRQYIKEPAYVTLPVFKVADREEMDRLLETRSQYPVPFNGESLIRAALIDIGGAEAAIVIRVNHFGADGYSIGLILREMTRLYRTYRAGEEPQEGRRFSYVDFMRRDREYMHSEAIKKDNAYWKQLHKSQRHVQSPFRTHRSQKGETDLYLAPIEGERFEQFTALCTRETVSPVFLTMFAAALTSYVLLGRDNFLLYDNSHGRFNYAQRQTIGCLFYNHPVYYDINGDEKIIDFLRRERGFYLEQMSHGRTGMWHQLFYTLRHAFSKGYPNIWEFFFSGMDLMNGPEQEFECQMLPQTYLVHQMYGLISGRSNGIDLVTIYQKDYISREDMEKLQATFMRILCAILDDPEARVGDLRRLAKEDGEEDESRRAGILSAGSENSRV